MSELDVNIIANILSNWNYQGVPIRNTKLLGFDSSLGETGMTQRGYTQQLLQTLATLCDKEKYEQLQQAVAEFVNPLGARGFSLPDPKDGKHPFELFTTSGGGGNIPNSGADVVLGGATTGTFITVNVASPAVIDIEMWMPFASVPAGHWTIGGPGSQRIYLGCNLYPGCSVPAGQLATIKGLGVGGNFPAYVSYNAS